jgi:hypothetical protein
MPLARQLVPETTRTSQYPRTSAWGTPQGVLVRYRTDAHQLYSGGWAVCETVQFLAWPAFAGLATEHFIPPRG